MATKQIINLSRSTVALLQSLSVFLNKSAYSIVDDFVKEVGEDFLNNCQNIEYEIINTETKAVYWFYSDETIKWVKLAKSKTNALNYGYCYDYLIKNYLMKYMKEKELVEDYKKFSSELVEILLRTSIR